MAEIIVHWSKHKCISNPLVKKSLSAVLTGRAFSFVLRRRTKRKAQVSLSAYNMKGYNMVLNALLTITLLFCIFTDLISKFSPIHTGPCDQTSRTYSLIKRKDLLSLPLAAISTGRKHIEPVSAGLGWLLSVRSYRSIQEMYLITTMMAAVFLIRPWINKILPYNLQPAQTPTTQHFVETNLAVALSMSQAVIL